MGPGTGTEMMMGLTAAPSPGGESVGSGSSVSGVAPSTAVPPTSIPVIGGAAAASKREAAESDDGAKSKKKKTGPGSRGVANLTPEQLAKKRANDREAQRAIRERTKNQIESLERRIQELTSQQPYQDLQAVLRAKEAVEQENVEIKRRLASIVAMLQPLIGQGAVDQAFLSPGTTHAAPQGHPHHHHHASSTLSVHSSAPANNAAAAVAASTPGSASSPSSLDPATSSWQRAGSSSSSSNNAVDVQARSQLNQQRHELRHGLEMGPERLGLDFLLEGAQQRVPRLQNGLSGAQDSGQFQHVPMKHDWTAISYHRQLHARPASSTPWGTAAAAAGIPTATTGDAHPHHHNHNHHLSPPVPVSMPDMSTPSPGPASASGLPPGPPPGPPIMHSEPTCPLDSLLIDFLNERRQRAADGLPAQEVIGPRYPSVSSLLNPAQSVYSHPLSKVFTDILTTFPDISTLPERVAVLYMMFLVMRWQIDPSPENHDRLPDWFHPTPAQLSMRHPAWIDHVPFPKMREQLVRQYNPQQYLFDNFFVPFTATLSLSWPYEETDTLLQSPDGEEVMINPVFERHMRNLENWKLGEAFAKAFPTLVDTFNLDTKGRRAGKTGR